MTFSNHKTTPQDNSPGGRVGLGAKTAYGLGGLAENTMHNAVNNMANPVFNVGLGVSPVLIGLATSIFRLWDAVTDPVMGVISDRSSTRIGRRRPFIFLGAILASLLFVVIWWVPAGWSPLACFWWFLVVCLLFYSAFTIFGVPYLALGYEMSQDYNERTRVMAFRTWFASVGGIGIQWLFWLTQRDIFEDTVEGMRFVGLGVGVVLLLCALAPSLFIKERILSAQERAVNRETIRFRGMFSVLKVAPFRILLGVLISAVLGMFTVAILGFYINVYYVFGGDLRASATVIGVSGSFYHICCLLSIPLIAWTSSRIGKCRALMLFLSIAVVGTLLKWWMFTPAAPYLQLVVTGLMAPGLSALWTLTGSMIADVTDWDQQQSGLRREGSFGALYNWTLKMGFAVCFLVAGLILHVCGFDEALGGAQSESTLFWLRFLYAVVPAAGLLVAILFVAKYATAEAQVRAMRRNPENP